MRLGYVPALDGVRGVAILLVIGRHYWLTPHGGGGAGVNLFFVLSGFLITTLLIEEHVAHGRVSLRGFYQRRARRLLPALAVTLAGYLVVSSLAGDGAEAGRAVLAGGFYTANIVEAFWPHLMAGQPIGPLWSLSLEEQFYLLWPVALIGVYRLRPGMRTVIVGLAGMIAADWGWRIWLAVHGAGETRLMTSPDTHADALLTGVLLAFILRERRRFDEGLAVVALFVFGTVAFFGPVEAINGPWVDLGAAGIIVFAVQDGSWLSRTLSWSPLVWFGGISYSLYLWHMLALDWFGGEGRWSALIAAVGIAWLSTSFVERPFRNTKAARPHPKAGAGRQLVRARV